MRRNKYSQSIVIAGLSLGCALLALPGCHREDGTNQQQVAANPPQASGTNTLIEEPEPEPKASGPVAGKVREARGGRSGSQDSAGSGDNADNTGDAQDEQQPPRTEADSEAGGKIVYGANRCAMCHGENREGTDLAPPLRDIADYWNESEMLKYFKAPDVYLPTNPRLVDLRHKYGNVSMPAFEGEPDDARSLVQWLLAD